MAPITPTTAAIHAFMSRPMADAEDLVVLEATAALAVAAVPDAAAEAVAFPSAMLWY